MEKIAISLLLACSLRVAPAFAEDGASPDRKITEAQSRFRRGTQLYEENDLPAALAEFERAYELAPNFRLHYNLGQVHFQMQNYAGALKSFRAYLKEGGSDVPASRRTDVTRDIEKLEGRVGTLEIRSRAGLEVLVNDVSRGVCPLPAAILVNVGRHRVTMVDKGQTVASRSVEIAGQQNVVVDIVNDKPRADPLPVVSKPIIELQAAPSKTIPWIAAATTLALGVSAGVLAGLAASSSADLVALRTSYPVTETALSAASSRTRNLAIAADVLTATTLVAAIVTTVLVVRAWPLFESPKATVSVLISPRSIALGATF
jgi:hypothetical protein